jgi:hypothetical protein
MLGSDRNPMTVFLDDLDKKSDEELIAIKNGKIPFFISAKSTITREDYMSQAETILHKRQLSSMLHQRAINPGTALDTVGYPSEKGDTWKNIEKEYGVSKKAFGKKINFVKDDFKRKIIFRDIEQAYFLAFNGFSKPAVILAGGVIEELLRLYIESKGIKSQNNTLESYIKTCAEKGILKKAIHKLADSFREFRNLVHLQREESPKHSISTPTGKSAVASVFTIINDFGT